MQQKINALRQLNAKSAELLPGILDVLDDMAQQIDAMRAETAAAAAQEVAANGGA